MTAPEFEIEAEPVPASHLVRTRCSVCGARDTLSTPERAMLRVSRCGACIRQAAGTAAPVATGRPGPVVGFPFVRQDAPLADPVPPHPEPEYVGEWLRGIEMPTGLAPAPPRAVLSLAELAREEGWEVEMRYARGTSIHAAHGTPLAVQHSIALRFDRHPLTERRAVAVYASPAAGKPAWKWDGVWVIGEDIGWRSELTLAELKTFLQDPQAPAAWFADIAANAAEAARRAKERAKMKPCAEDCAQDHVHKAAPRKREAAAGA